MPRKPTWGTPTRAEHHPSLRKRWQFLYPSAIAAAAVAVVLIGGHLVGLRGSLSPGTVTGAHGSIDASCEQCHTTGRGVSNVRCQRCHDPASAGRLTASAHVLFGSSDPRKAAAAPDLACATCHVEHKGRSATISAVPDIQCARCHFGSLRRHPEFAVLRASTTEAPGMNFGHKKHIEDVMKEQGLTQPAQTCATCHQKNQARRDFEPINFDQHCASCHSKQGSVGVVDPVPLTDVVDLEGLKARSLTPAVAAFKPEEFEVARGKIARPSLHHRDAWVIFNLARLRAESDPEAFAGERARVEARIASLERKLAAATPFASLDRAALVDRAAALQRESEGASQRLAALGGAGDASTGVGRLQEIETGLRATDAAAADEIAKLRTEASAKGAGPAPLPIADFEARRQEVLGLLEAVEAADPALKPRTADLRRRIVALQPGENAADLLGRVRDQRQASLDRLKDEIKLRDQGIGPPRGALLDANRRDIERALAEARAQLAALQAAATTSTLTDEERQKKRETAAVLAAACTKCHILKAGAFAPVRAARPVLARARFIHEPHLIQADCAKCHPGIEASKVSKDLNFKGIQSCRECHKAFQAKQDCRECHLFHPKAVP
jgi:c(7)-type cytochrome triheme protein